MPFIDWLLEQTQWLQKNEGLVALLSASSLVVFIGTLFFIPWAVLRIPADYFSNPNSDRYNPLGNHPLAIMLVDVLRNIVGICLMFVGIALLVLPGQGLLMIMLGIIVGRFPGKQRFIYWLVEKKGVHRTLNWVRRKGGKADIELKQPNVEP